MIAGETQALGDGSQTRPGGAGAGRNRSHEQQRHEACDERRDVEGERGGHTRYGDDDARHDRPDHGHGLATQPVDGDGRRQSFARNEPRKRRRPSGHVNRPDPSCHEGDHVQGPDRRARLAGEERQAEARDRQQDLRDDEQAAPVDGIGNGSAAQREDEDRYELDDRQQPDRERAVGQLPELERQRHDGDLSAQAVDELAQPQHPELAVAPDRLQVHEETSESSASPAISLGHGRRIGECARSAAGVQSVVSSRKAHAAERQKRRPARP